MSNRKVLVLALIAVLAFAGYWFVWRQSPVVAVVNGERIARADLNQRVEMATAEYWAHGIEVTGDLLATIEHDILEELITETLLLAAATAAGISVSDEEIDDYYQDMAADYGGEEAFEALLIESGYTPERLKSEIARYLTIELLEGEYIAANFPADVLTISQEEIQELYDYYSAMMEDIPPLEEIWLYLQEELREERISELQIREGLIDSLRLEATIKVTL